MSFLDKTLDGRGRCLAASIAAHGALAGALACWLIARQAPPIVAELDLSMNPLLAPNPGGGRASKTPEWTAPKKNPPPAPTHEAEKAPAPERTKASAAPAGPASPVGTGGGGSGAGVGQYVPVSQTARKPRWLSNFITSDDYPPVARQQGKDGRVVLSILIDAEGKVRDARLLKGSYPVLNEVALRKIKEAVFSPAYDASGHPVACKVTLPIRFELR